MLKIIPKLHPVLKHDAKQDKEKAPDKVNQVAEENLPRKKRETEPRCFGCLRAKKLPSPALPPTQAELNLDDISDPIEDSPDRFMDWT